MQLLSRLTSVRVRGKEIVSLQRRRLEERNRELTRLKIHSSSYEAGKGISFASISKHEPPAAINEQHDSSRS